MTTPASAIKKHLYLQAVIPALRMLVRLDPEARDLAARLKRPVRLLVGQGDTAETTMGWEEGAFDCRPGLHRPGTLTLWFPSTTRFLAMMEEDALPLALPVSGWTGLAQLPAFEKLMKRMEQFLKPENPSGLPPDRLARHVHMQLAVATACVPVLAVHDDPSRRQVGHLPPGTAVFSCDPSLPSCWVRVEPGSVTAGIGTPPHPESVHVHFSDPVTGQAALSDRLDQMAAVGDGRIRITGLVPLADGLDLVLNRIQRYLPTP